MMIIIIYILESNAMAIFRIEVILWVFGEIGKLAKYHMCDNDDNISLKFILVWVSLVISMGNMWHWSLEHSCHFPKLCIHFEN